MSLVAYGSSDESSDEEIISNQGSEESTKKTPETVESKQSLNNVTFKEASQIEKIQQIVKPVKPRAQISLPTPKDDQQSKIFDENYSDFPSNTDSKGKINFNLLPQPRPKPEINEDEEDIVPTMQREYMFEQHTKVEKLPAKISIPRLSDFKDADEEEKKPQNRTQLPQKRSGLMSILPPPKSEVTLKLKPMVPHVLTKKSADPKPQQEKVIESKKASIQNKKEQKSAIASNYDSSSEDEETDKAPAMDFFSLASAEEIQVPAIPIADVIKETLKYSKPQFSDLQNINTAEMSVNDRQQLEIVTPEKMLVSNVMNLPKEEIIKKNKAEVGPKLPVPEQDYNVDSTGNVVFDEKAIEYLCGKRGVKRRNKEFDDVDIIDINGEDIKPDEREWLVKALTEETVTRPVSSQGAGPSGQSKKKHQITYLAHQAKAMEVELKNKWAQNKMTRQQTQSKYGF